jgi:putative transposase
MSWKRTKKLRLEAVRRYQTVESATDICRSLGKSRKWFYKWLQRKAELEQDPGLKQAHNRTPPEIKKAVAEARKKLQKTKYAQIGVNAINRELYLQGIALLPASTINRILVREGLIRKKASRVSKGKAYLKLEASFANNIHQADIVGPRFIKGDGRFYCLKIMDIATHRVKLNPSRRKDDESMAEGLIQTWKKLELPDFLHMYIFLRENCHSSGPILSSSFCAS